MGGVALAEGNCGPLFESIAVLAGGFLRPQAQPDELAPLRQPDRIEIVAATIAHRAKVARIAYAPF